MESIFGDNEKRLKIMIISRGYPSKKYPMNGIFEFDQAKALAKLGYKVIFAVIDMRSIRRWRKWGIEVFEKDGIEIYAINYPIGNIPLSVLLFFYDKALRRVYKKIKINVGRPDILHAHFARIGHAAVKLKETTGIPLVITEHFSGLMNNPIEKKVIELGKQVYFKANKVITVSPALNMIIHNRFNVDNIYVPNMVDSSSFKYFEEEKYSSFTFISVGSLIYRKRMDLLIDAFKSMLNDYKDIKLIIVGEGIEKSRLEKLIDENDLTNVVKLTGGVERTVIAEYMSRSHCFVLASRAETFGVVYIEAMLMGLPVIATKCGGPEGFISEKNGLLIDVDDKDQLVQALKTMYKNADQYNRQKIIDETNQKFAPEKVAMRIFEVYQKVLKEDSKND